MVFEEKLNAAVSTTINKEYSGVKLQKLDDKTWTLEIPQEYKIGHEQHFEEVTKNYLKYLKKGNMPAWEIPNMIVKYYTTSEAFKFVNKNN